MDLCNFRMFIARWNYFLLVPIKNKKMVVSVLKTPGANCFLGNPICFQFRSEAYGQIDVSVSFQGETFTQSYYPFKKAGYYYYTFDISSFLYREYTSDSFKQGVEMISELSDF